MLGLDLVRPLEDDWRDTLDSVARRRGWPGSGDVRALAARLAALSSAYNDPAVARAAVKDAGPARLAFAFARDVPKGAAAVRELVATGVLSVPRPANAPLRVLDVGAGLGATTWGLVRALEANGRRKRARVVAAGEEASGTPTVSPTSAVQVHATWVDADTKALEVASEVVRARGALGGAGSIALSVTAVAGSIGRGPTTTLPVDDSARYDVVLVGQVLSELDVGEPPDVRVDRHAALLGALLDRNVDAHGALVVVEPALRDRTRHLHRVRDVLAARGATVFAPCLHAGPCPALAVETDWCHEDLPIDLPRWLVPVARAAGLRREGLTFSYLVLRRDGVRLADHAGHADDADQADNADQADQAGPPVSRPGAARLRVVSDLIRTKGKREAFVCGELGDRGERGERGDRGAPAAALRGSRVKVERLDRDRTRNNLVWDRIARGDLLVVDPPPNLRHPVRIGEEARVIRWGDAETR
jgi:ribosomal protein RSM22 (predicted rRNA methylase)